MEVKSQIFMMWIKSIFFVLVCNITVLEAQNLAVFKIVNQKDNSPVAYANIRVKNQNKGTYSNEEGKFQLALTSQDTLLISSVGYKEIEIPFSSIENNTIYMNEKSIVLEEIQIFSTKDNSPLELGYFDKKGRKTLKMSSLSKLDNAVYVPNANKSANLLIKKINLSIKRENENTTILKVHLYNVREGKPGNDLLPENIILRQTEVSKENEVSLDVEKYNLMLPPEGIFVSIECLGFIDAKTGLIYDDALQISNQTRNIASIVYIKDNQIKNNMSFIGYYGTWQENTYLRKEGKSIYPTFGITVVEVDR